jgi:uncharacterized protein
MMNNKIERRFTFGNGENTFTNNAEFRAKAISNGDNTSRTIRGYGVVFDQKSKIITEYVQDKGEWRTFNEIIAPESFDNILANIANYDVILNINHRSDEILARTASGTLKIAKDTKGLTYETELADNARGQDVLTMVTRGDYYESSFQFIVAEGGDKWELDQTTGIYTRTITNIEILIDMCVATYRGAYNNTSIEAGKRVFSEYEENDIQVAKRKLNELCKITTRIENVSNENTITDTPDYNIELENDTDKLKILN